MYTSTSLPSVKLLRVSCNRGKAGSKYTQSAARTMSGDARSCGIDAALQLVTETSTKYQSNSRASMRDMLWFRLMLAAMILTIASMSVIYTTPSPKSSSLAIASLLSTASSPILQYPTSLDISHIEEPSSTLCRSRVQRQFCLLIDRCL